MNPRDMTDEQLADAVEEMFNSPDFDKIKFEAASRLREMADYKAEAMAARQAMDQITPASYEEESMDWYKNIRTANAAKEAGR